MQQALGWLRWPPDAFWGATLAEIHSALTGYLESRGVKSPAVEAESWGDIIAMARAARAREIAAARG